MPSVCEPVEILGKGGLDIVEVVLPGVESVFVQVRPSAASAVDIQFAVVAPGVVEVGLFNCPTIVSPIDNGAQSSEVIND